MTTPTWNFQVGSWEFHVGKYQRLSGSLAYSLMKDKVTTRGYKFLIRSKLKDIKEAFRILWLPRFIDHQKGET